MQNRYIPGGLLMIFLIYRTTNLINNKIYIGKHKTENLDDGYLGSGKLLQRAIKKYRIENFKREIISSHKTEDEMNAAEKILVTEEFCSRKDNYNLCPGGHGGFGYINEHKNKKKWAKKGNLAMLKLPSKDRSRWARMGAIRTNSLHGMSDEFKQAGKTSFLNKKHTDKTKKIIGNKNSIHMTGSGNSQFGTIWITDGKINKKIKKDSICPDGWIRGRIKS